MKVDSLTAAAVLSLNALHEMETSPLTPRAARGRGVARGLYDDLTDKARAAGHTVLACEINLEPANPVSLAFHRARGFAEVGQAALSGTKRVSYQTLAISASRGGSVPQG